MLKPLIAGMLLAAAAPSQRVTFNGLPTNFHLNGAIYAMTPGTVDEFVFLLPADPSGSNAIQFDSPNVRMATGLPRPSYEVRLGVTDTVFVGAPGSAPCQGWFEVDYDWGTYGTQTFASIPGMPSAWLRATSQGGPLRAPDWQLNRFGVVFHNTKWNGTPYQNPCGAGWVMIRCRVILARIW